MDNLRFAAPTANRIPRSHAGKHPAGKRLLPLFLLFLLVLPSGCGKRIPDITAVPILMYHAFTENPEEQSSTILSVSVFREQLAALRDAGYTAVTYADLLAYADGTAALPEKPILLTFDDGYRSNLTLAAPVLEEFGMCAAVSVIGVSVGKDSYKDTGVPMFPHFSYAEAQEYYRRGILDFQSHTYDMHNNSLDTDFRDGVLQKDGESDSAYEAALRADWKRSKEELESGIGCSVFVIVYPFGKATENADAIFADCGAAISVTTRHGVSTLRRGDPASLRLLCRINVEPELTGERLLSTLAELCGQK